MNIAILLSALVLAGTAVRAASDTDHGEISIVTLNIAKVKSSERILREISAVPALRSADVLLLQEVSEQAGVPHIADSLAAALGLHVAYTPTIAGTTDGLAILSRFPLRDLQNRSLKTFDLRFRSRARFSLSATAETPFGPVRLYDTHLDTRINSVDRISQLEPVVRDSAAFGDRRVIAGDFNSNPFYWIGHLLPLPSFRSQANAIKAFMLSYGFQTAIPQSPSTFDYLRMRLDWIWLGGLRTLESRVIPLSFTDHHAVWTRVAL